jgi:hypothetical protein
MKMKESLSLFVRVHLNDAANGLLMTFGLKKEWLIYPGTLRVDRFKFIRMIFLLILNY